MVQGGHSKDTLGYSEEQWRTVSAGTLGVHWEIQKDTWKEQCEIRWYFVAE
jgi:hypothetical protein